MIACVGPSSTGASPIVLSLGPVSLGAVDLSGRGGGSSADGAAGRDFADAGESSTGARPILLSPVEDGGVAPAADSLAVAPAKVRNRLSIENKGAAAGLAGSAATAVGVVGSSGIRSMPASISIAGTVIAPWH